MHPEDLSPEEQREAKELFIKRSANAAVVGGCIQWMAQMYSALMLGFRYALQQGHEEIGVHCVTPENKHFCVTLAVGEDAASESRSRLVADGTPVLDFMTAEADNPNEGA